MLDRFLLPVVHRFVRPLAVFLHRHGVGADGLTLSGFAIGLTAVPALGFRLHGLALAAILANRILDALDGAVARLAGPTDRGAFLDIALDFIFYGSIPLGFALADPTANALPAAVLLATFVGSGSSFLAFAALAAKRGLTSDVFPQKGIYYLTGLTEGTETIGAFALMCLFPAAFPAIAYAFALACLVTIFARLRQGWASLGVLDAAGQRATPDRPKSSK